MSPIPHEQVSPDHHVGRRLLSLVAVLSAAALIATGCGDDNDNGSAAGGGAETTEQAASDTVAEAKTKVEEARGEPSWKEPGPAFDASAAKGKTVHYIGLAMAIPIVKTLYDGMEDGLATVGAKAVAYDGKGQVSEFNRSMQQAISRKADAIVLEAIDPKVVAAGIADAEEAGIPVIVSQDIDSTSPLPENVDGRVSFCYSCVGALIADWVIQDSNGKAKATIFVSRDTPPSTPEERGMVEEFERLCPDCEIEVENVAVADWQTRLPTLTQSVLRQRLDTEYLLPLFDGMATFIVPAIQSAGKADQVKVASFNATPSVMEEMAKGDIVAANVGGANVWQGWGIADQAMRLMTGQDAVEDENIPIRLFTDENLDQIDLKASEDKWYGSTDFRSEYKQLWGAG